MAEYNMMKPAVAIMAIAIMGSLAVSMVAQTAPPGPTYCCPICERLGTGVCFFTYNELADHFAVEHPSEPIDIVWD